MTDAVQAALTRANQSVLERIYAEYGRGNRAYALDLLAEDVAWHSLAAPGIPWGGTFHGRAGVERYFAEIDRLVQLTAYEVERIIVQGDWAVTLARGTGRFHATGEVVSIPKADMVRLRDGRVAEFREYYDGVPMAAAVARCRGAAG